MDDRPNDLLTGFIGGAEAMSIFRLCDPERPVRQPLDMLCKSTLRNIVATMMASWRRILSAKPLFEGVGHGG
jgi:hypothetical protein